MTRIPGALWVPGPPNKLGYRGVPAYSNIMAGITEHSLEGTRAGVVGQLWNPLAGSWCATIMTDGVIWQHYELEAVCWANGNAWANKRFVAFEHEGFAGQPLTEAQLASSIFATRFVADIPTAYPLAREPVSARTLWEHNEVVLLSTPNSGPTDCPSDRIPWDRYVAAPAPPPAPPVLMPNVQVRQVSHTTTPDGFEYRWEIDVYQHWDDPAHLGPNLSDLGIVYLGYDPVTGTHRYGSGVSIYKHWEG